MENLLVFVIFNQSDKVIRKLKFNQQICRLGLLFLMQIAKRVFITGSNRGLGYQLVKILNKKHPQLQLHIASRKPSSQLAVQWETHIPNHRLKCYQIDLNSPESLQSAAQNIKKSEIKFDYIVANAGVCYEFGQTMPSYQIANTTLKTNFESTISFIKSFISLLSSNGRVIIVSAQLGALSFQKQPVRKNLENPNITEDQLLKISNLYIEAAKKQSMGNFHWSAYFTSKALLNTWSRFILPTYLKQGQTSISMHPGWCSTDMGGQNAPLTPQQGAFLIYDCFWLKEVQKDSFYNGKFCSYVQCHAKQ